MSGGPAPEQTLTAEQAARYLQVHVRTVHRWCREGRLPAIRAGRRYRVRLEDLKSMSADGAAGSGVMTAAPALPRDREGASARARVVAIGNQKGGVGKTTTTQALGAALAEQGARVLLVDFDPQASLTTSVGLEPAMISPTIYDVMEAFLQRAPSPTTADAIHRLDDWLDLLPSNISLSVADYTLVQRVRREYVLDELLEPVRSSYDWIFIDCPPTLSLLTINALTCADSCVIPVVPEPLVTATVHLFLNTVLDVRRSKLNPRLSVGGIVLTRTEPRSALAREVADALRQAVGEGIPILGEVRESGWVRHATAERVLLTRYGNASEAAAAYRRIGEVLAHAS
jgi:chromosome partitioning protein